MPDRFVHRIKSLGEIARQINIGGDLDTILDRIVFAVCRHSDWMMSSILSIDEDAGLSRSIKRFDPYLTSTEQVRTTWELSTSPVAEVVRTQQPLIIENAHHSEQYPAYREDARQRGYSTVVILPLYGTDDHDRPMVLSVQSREQVTVSEREISFLMMVAELATLAVDKTLSLQAESDTAEKLRSTVDAYTRVMRPVLEGGDVPAITTELDRIVVQPWLVVDLAGNTVLTRRSPLPDAASDEVWRKWASAAGKSRLFELARSLQANASGEEHVLDTEIDGIAINLPVAVQSLAVDGELVGALLLFAKRGELDDFDLLQAQAVRLALSALMMRNVVRSTSEAISQGRVLHRLFAGEWESRADFLTRADAVGIDLQTPKRLVVVGGLEDALGADGLAMPWVHHMMRRQFEDAFDACATTNVSGLLIALIPAGQSEQPAFKGKIQRARDVVRNAAGTDPVIVVSDNCQDLLSYRDNKARCERLVQLAHLLGAKGLVSAEDFGAFPVLFSMADKAEVQTFLDLTVRPIVAEGGKRAMRRLETIRTFVETDGRYQECADRLGVHVSTLRYRLEQVSQRFGVDVTDPAERFDFRVALRLYDLGESFGRPDRHLFPMNHRKN